MAVSLANTLTSRLWKGEPKVVIRGRFSLGLVRDSASTLYLAPFLYLGSGQGGLAASPAFGETFSVQVDGRQPVYVSGQDDHLDTAEYFLDWASLANPSDAGNAYHHVDPYYAIYQDDDGYAESPSVCPSVQAVAAAKTSKTAFTSESDAVSAYPTSLKTVVADNVRVILRGRLSFLNLGNIRAAGFAIQESSAGATPKAVVHTVARTTLMLDGASQTTGWHPLDVHIYDNPGLRDHVVNPGNVPVFWG